MTTRMVMLRTGDINKQEVVGILAENTDQFCQHLYAWLENVKIATPAIQELGLLLQSCSFNY